jgi:hypothetical protein
MSLHDGEVWAAYRAKRRPCVVIACDSPKVDPSIVRGMPSHATAPTCLVAPYYGIKGGVKRSGYQAAFVERVRHCEFPQFMWDHLPFNNGEESILRLDQLQPIGAHYKAYKLSSYRLCNDGLAVLDELMGWLIHGGVRPESWVAQFRKEIEATFS